MKLLLQKRILIEIIKTTTEIQKEFPELYRLLPETPLFQNEKGHEIKTINFEKYLETLKAQLASFRNMPPSSDP